MSAFRSEDLDSETIPNLTLLLVDLSPMERHLTVIIGINPLKYFGMFIIRLSANIYAFLTQLKTFNLLSQHILSMRI